MPQEQMLEWIEHYKPNKEWQKTQALKGDKLSFLHAIVEHKAWIQELMDGLDNRLTTTAQLDARLCHFGSWMEHYFSSPTAEFERLSNLHDALHTTAKKIVERDDEDATQEALDELKRQSRELLALLEAMSQE